MTGDVVNLRSGAGTSYKQVGQVRKGDSFIVLRSAVCCLHLIPQLTASVLAAVQHCQLVALINLPYRFIACSRTAAQIDRITCHDNAICCFRGSYKQVGQVRKGDSFIVLRSSNDTESKAWYQVEMEDGAKVWIASWLISTTKPSSTASTVSTGVRTSLELKPVLQDGKKTVISLKHGEGNVYSLEKVSGTQLQLLLDNVTLGGQTNTQGNGFHVALAEAGDNRVRVTINY